MSLTFIDWKFREDVAAVVTADEASE